MEKKAGRPKIYSNPNKPIHVRATTLDLIKKYQDQQFSSSGIMIHRGDIIDIAIKALIKHENFFQYVTDFYKEDNLN
jgi:hypothetical protein